MMHRLSYQSSRRRKITNYIMSLTTEQLIGHTITFWTYPNDDIYTGLVQEVVNINGSASLLVLISNSFHIFSVTNIYCIRVVDQDTPEQEPEQPQSTDRLFHEEQVNYIVVDSDDEESSINHNHYVPPNENDETIHIQNENTENTENTTENEDTEHVCSICFDSIDMNKNAVSIECGHKFHFTCIIKNMAFASAAENKCPLCREPVLEGFGVYNHDDTAMKIIQKVTHQNQQLMLEVENTRMTREMLQYELEMTERIQQDIRENNIANRQAAIETVARQAIQVNLYNRIAQVVVSAANNNIYENFDEIHQFYEDEIKNLCLNFGLTLLYNPRHTQEDDDHREDGEYGEEDVQHVQQQPVTAEILHDTGDGGDRLQPILID